MGLGPPVIELYRQLKLQGALDGVTNVMELGSQDFWCPQKNLVKALFAAFGRPEPDPELLTTSNASQQPARLLYEALGIEYNCVDVDGRSGTLVLDLNFDPAPEEHWNKYGLVTNHGTSEHIMNQLNVFKMMHEFAKPGGAIIHAVPFTVHLEHGFFNYQPNFFEALARYNSYETLGLWVGPDWQLASFIPWDPILLDYLALNSKTTHLLVVAHRKMYDKPFCVPFQEIYEGMVPDEVRSRYAMVVDGEVLDGKRVKYLTKDEMLAKEYKTEIMGLNNWIAAYKGQIDALKHELSVTKHHFDQLRYGPPPEPFSGQIAALARELADLQAAHTETVKQLQEQITQHKASNEALKQDAVEHTKAKDLARELRHRIRRRLAASIGMG
jgi:cell division protein FtsB